MIFNSQCGGEMWLNLVFYILFCIMSAWIKIYTLILDLYFCSRLVFFNITAIIIMNDYHYYFIMIFVWVLKTIFTFGFRKKNNLQIYFHILCLLVPCLQNNKNRTYVIIKRIVASSKNIENNKQKIK